MVVLVFLFGTVTISQSNLAFAASSEKIPLVQKHEQFEGQEVTGFCYLQQNEGNVEWRIKVSGLVPQTQGHFDLGHWAGEDDVPYTADENGDADSKNQIINLSKVNSGLFSEFANCKVYLEGSSHFISPVIAIGEPGSANQESQTTNQNLSEKESLENNSKGVALGKSDSGERNVDNFKNLETPEKKFFLFSIFESIFELFTNSQNESTANNSNIKRGVPFSNTDPNDASITIDSDKEETEQNNSNQNNKDSQNDKNSGPGNDKGNDAKPEDKGKPVKGNDAKPEDKGKPVKGNDD
ncbi:MAG: hypothetical protein GTO72_05155 [Nitrosopumilaceae archaeon]|nr:hypothetical protein [Nitrosopumilaceae archaeon]NIP09984.1 hypothetical protein [Nitrosopumilaceae archaeon]